MDRWTWDVLSQVGCLVVTAILWDTLGFDLLLCFETQSYVAQAGLEHTM